MQRHDMPVPLHNPREPRRNSRAPTAPRRTSARWTGVAGRVLLVALLGASTSGSVWAVSLAMAPGETVPTEDRR